MRTSTLRRRCSTRLAGPTVGGGGVGRGLGLLSLFDYKEHGVVDAIVPTKIRRGLPVRPITAVRQPPAGLGSPDLHFLRCPLPAPDGPCVLTRPLGEDGINNNNNNQSRHCLRSVGRLWEQRSTLSAPENNNHGAAVLGTDRRPTIHFTLLWPGIGIRCVHASPVVLPYSSFPLVD